MAIKVGLVGLPNVGKSTLFNALTKSTIAAQNFPFCTIDPNLAITPVPDNRLLELAKIFGSKAIIPCSINFVDIAGLVKGASKGQGLGNQFLSHIMEVDLIIHVLRCFEDGDIIHVNNQISPLDDFATISAELMFKDLESIEKRDLKIQGLLKKTSDLKAKKLLEEELKFNDKIKKSINDLDIEAVKMHASTAEKEEIPLIQLLSAKNFLIAANFVEGQMQDRKFETDKIYQDLIAKFGSNKIIPVSAKVEEDLSQLSDDEQLEMREILQIDGAGFNQLISQAYAELNLISYFTCGPKETHAWSIKKGTLAPAAAGEIHSDLERGFICVETYNYKDLVQFGSEQSVKNAGKIKVEGKDYIVQDGDLLNVRFNV